MDMSGEYRISAPKERVWAALNDAEVLKASIPGAQTVEKISETEFTATVIAKVGPVKTKFKGKVTLSDLDPPNGYTISGEGQGGPAGFAKGGASVRLRDDGEGTLLTYEAKASVGGKLAQIGSRLIDATARKMADDFFSAFATEVGGVEAVEAAEPAAEAPVAEAAPAKIGGLSPLAWGVGIVVLVLIVLYIYNSS